MKKSKQLNEITRQFLIDDLHNAYNLQFELIGIAAGKNLDCQIEYYVWQINKLSEKIQQIQNIIVENKFY
jgi:hypothetical protein